MRDAEEGTPDVAAAIATIESSRATHAEWRDYWQEYEEHKATCTHPACPWEKNREDQEAIAGDLPRQVRLVAEYDNVLACLRSIRPGDPS